MTNDSREAASMRAYRDWLHAVRELPSQDTLRVWNAALQWRDSLEIVPTELINQLKRSDANDVDDVTKLLNAAARQVEILTEALRLVLDSQGGKFGYSWAQVEQRLHQALGYTAPDGGVPVPVDPYVIVMSRLNQLMFLDPEIGELEHRELALLADVALFYETQRYPHMLRVGHRKTS